MPKFETRGTGSILISLGLHACHGVQLRREWRFALDERFFGLLLGRLLVQHLLLFLIVLRLAIDQFCNLAHIHFGFRKRGSWPALLLAGG